MKLFSFFSLVVFSLTFNLFDARCEAHQPSTAQLPPLPKDQVDPNQIAGGAAPVSAANHPLLPILGKWMLKNPSQIANWLNAPLGKRTLLEPINVIVRIEAPSPKDALTQFLKAVKRAHFAPEYGHSDGYQVWTAGRFWPQISGHKKFALTDADFLFSNNHGRAFGPVPFQGKYYFPLAFSREGVAPFDRKRKRKFHFYQSFKTARDRFVKKMIEKNPNVVRLGEIDLKNQIDLPQFTTGDHDGKAIFLEIR